jgi:hypothetical protein
MKQFVGRESSMSLENERLFQFLVPFLLKALCSALPNKIKGGLLDRMKGGGRDGQPGPTNWYQ